MQNRFWYLFGGHKIDLFEVSYVSKALESEFTFLVSGQAVDMRFDNQENAQKARTVLCGELDKIQVVMRDMAAEARGDKPRLVLSSLTKGGKQ